MRREQNSLVYCRFKSNIINRKEVFLIIGDVNFNDLNTKIMEQLFHFNYNICFFNFIIYNTKTYLITKANKNFTLIAKSNVNHKKNVLTLDFTTEFDT